MRGGVVGAIFFEFDLACSRRLLGKKVRSQAAFFVWLSENSSKGKKVCHTNSPLTLPEP
jgi:hypothetical protein